MPIRQFSISANLWVDSLSAMTRIETTYITLANFDSVMQCIFSCTTTNPCPESIKELTLTLRGHRPFHFMARRPSLLPLALPPHPANSTCLPLSLSGIRSTTRPTPLSPLESTLAKVHENKGLYLPLESTLTQKPRGESPPSLASRHLPDWRLLSLTRTGSQFAAVVLLFLAMFQSSSAHAQQKAPSSNNGPRIEVVESSEEQHETLQEKPALTFGATRTPNLTITVNDAVRYQQIDGFGASLTDSSAWLIWNKLTEAQRKEALQMLFSPTKGIGLSILRQPMGASDFALTKYSYDDLPPGQPFGASDP